VGLIWRAVEWCGVRGRLRSLSHFGPIPDSTLSSDFRSFAQKGLTMRFAMITAAFGVALLASPAEAAIYIYATVQGNLMTKPGCTLVSTSPECLRPPNQTPITYSVVIELADSDYNGSGFSLSRSSGFLGGVTMVSGQFILPGIGSSGVGTNFTLSGQSTTASPYATFNGSAASFTTSRDARPLSFSSISVTAVPEPAAWGLLMLGFGGIGAVLRRRARVSFA
jgi:hypothetical protein